MSSNPKEYPYEITEWQMELLSKIFRIIVKEIKCDEDKINLAPGELGIDYKGGCFYIRNPHNGELFAPNSIEHVRQILEKYDPETGLLNADKVSYIRFYSSINQLHQLGISMSPDTVIRQMEYPAILHAPIEYKETYKTLGYPSESGVLEVVKISPEFVTVRYYDNLTFSYYDGKYNPFRQFFEGWSISGTMESEYLESIGGGNSTKIRSTRPKEDLMILAVRVTEELNPGATVSYNDGPYEPILMSNKKPLDHSIAPDNIIMLIYDKSRGAWVYTDPTEASITTVITIQQERLDSLTQEAEHMKKDYIERVAQLKRETERQIAALKARPGILVPITSMYTAPTNDVDTIAKVADFDPRFDHLIINYNQTILRAGIDYVFEVNATGTEAGLRFPQIRLQQHDVLQFIVMKQPVDRQDTPATTTEQKGV